MKLVHHSSPLRTQVSDLLCFFNPGLQQIAFPHCTFWGSLHSRTHETGHPTAWLWPITWSLSSRSHVECQQASDPVLQMERTWAKWSCCQEYQLPAASRPGQRSLCCEAHRRRVMHKQCPSAKSLIFLLQHQTCRSTGHPDDPAAPPLRTWRHRIKVTLSKHFLPRSLANKDPLPPQIQNIVIINCWQLRLHRNLKRKKMLKCMQIGCKEAHSFPEGSTVPSVG